MRIVVLLVPFFFILTFTNAQTARYPFPQHAGYTIGSIQPDTVSQTEMDDSVRSFYDQWKTRYLVAGCGTNEYFVFYDYVGDAQPSNAICVSEGQGYGMLVTALMAGYDAGAKTYFDGLYRYYRAHPSRVNNRLMAWRQRTGCTSEAEDSSSATDGDLDIAYALLLADKQWGSDGAINYLQEAYSIIYAIMADDINNDLFSVKLGDWSNSAEPMYYNATRSSDFMVNHFRVFQTVTGDTGWNAVMNNCYTSIATIQTNNSPVTGLLPDFIKNLHTTPIPAQANFLEGPNDGRYYYNACRDPWRIGTDYLLSGEARAKSAVQKMNTWLKSVTAGNPENVRAGYYLNGTVIHNDYVDMAFMAPLLTGAMVDSTNKHWLNALWMNVTQAGISADGYYGNSLKLLNMIVASGNWWNPSQNRTVAFSNYLWDVKNSGSEQWGPGPNYFSDNPANITVDSLGRLHLKITHREGAWQCAEVSLQQSLGYGRYVFHLESPVGTLNENAVLGLFTWDNDTAEVHREMDIEFARWGFAADPTNAQFVAQPYYTPGNLVRWTIPETMSVSTNSFHWQSESIDFLSAGGGNTFPPYHNVNFSWKYTGSNIPSPGNERAIINLWLMEGNAPSDSQEIEVIVSKFEFNPIPPPPEQPWLAAPTNGETTGSLPVQFRWNSSARAETYHVQLSLTETFSSIIMNDSSVTDTSFPASSLTSGTTYYWRVRAKNSGGISSWSEVRSVTFISANKWMLVSVPFTVADPRKTTLFPTALSPAFAYTANGYVMADSLVKGQGYWLKFGADTSSNITGEPILADTFHVFAGWNLIGSISVPAEVVSIQSDPDDNLESSFFGYDGSYKRTTVVVPGRAYWVKVKANGTFILQ